MALQTCAKRAAVGGSDDRLADAAWVRVDAEGVVDGALLGFGLRGGAHVQGAAVGPSEGGGDALLALDETSEGGPTGVAAWVRRRVRMNWTSW